MRTCDEVRLHPQSQATQLHVYNKILPVQHAVLAGRFPGTRRRLTKKS